MEVGRIKKKALIPDLKGHVFYRAFFELEISLFMDGVLNPKISVKISDNN